MLFEQKTRLLRFDPEQAVVGVPGTWHAMVRNRLPLLESAMAGALSSHRTIGLQTIDLQSGDAPPGEAGTPS
jgi:hypothetical protein